MNENAIEVKNVSKCFRIYPDKGYSLRDKLLFWKRNRYEKLQVLQDISFSIKKGEAVGLIGHNGCGKSTTLKMLTRIIYPDSGQVIMTGRVSSLLELGAGFHPDMTGLENIYINASILGLKKKEIDKRIDDIINFAELGNFLSNPVRTYSSGMYMRLAFAVAINVDADILLIDEILAVGDAKFRDKCLKKLKEIKENGTTIVLVSHSLGQIESFCNRSIWLHNGQICKDGSPKEVHKEYLAFMDDLIGNKKQPDAPCSNDGVTIKEIKISDTKGTETTKCESGGAVNVEVAYGATCLIENPIFTVRILTQNNIYCYGTDTKLDKISLPKIEKEEKVQIVLSNIYLMPGNYKIVFVIKDCKGKEIIKKDKAIQVIGTSPRSGVVAVKTSWKI